MISFPAQAKAIGDAGKLEARKCCVPVERHKPELIDSRNPKTQQFK